MTTGMRHDFTTMTRSKFDRIYGSGTYNAARMIWGDYADPADPRHTPTQPAATNAPTATPAEPFPHNALVADIHGRYIGRVVTSAHYTEPDDGGYTGPVTMVNRPDGLVQAYATSELHHFTDTMLLKVGQWTNQADLEPGDIVLTNAGPRMLNTTLTIDVPPARSVLTYRPSH